MPQTVKATLFLVQLVQKLSTKVLCPVGNEVPHESLLVEIHYGPDAALLRSERCQNRFVVVEMAILGNFYSERVSLELAEGFLAGGFGALRTECRNERQQKQGKKQR